MIVLYTDFGVTDPYVGQMHAALVRDAPGVPVIDLLHTVPDFDVRAGAYLLPAFAAQFPESSIFVCVVDPGVGNSRLPVLLHADRRWYIGPDNGLFHVVERRARSAETWALQWQPKDLSISFHGRDLFAPIAARLSRGEWPPAVSVPLTAPSGWPDDLFEVIYIDHYGNGITGVRASKVTRSANLLIAGRRLSYASVFSAVPEGTPFWYENSVGLVEIAVNRGSAVRVCDLKLGMPFDVA